ncbi:MAG: HlyD family efflux transporter periplasmic adaptor subunit [Bacteroidota bacterium]
MKIRHSQYITLSLGLALAGCSPTVTTTPEEKDILEAVFASGNTIQDHEYHVTAKAEGYLEASLVKEGDEVHIGEPMFRIAGEVQTQQLAQAQAQYDDAQAQLAPTSPQTQQFRLQIEQARIQLAADEKNHLRYQELIKTQAVSQLDFERVALQYEGSKANLALLEQSLAELETGLALQLKNAETQLAIQQENQTDYLLNAALNGQVLRVSKKEGELVHRGESIAQLGGGATLIRLFVAEEDINRVVEGQKVLVSLNTHPDETYEAKVSKVYPAFDAQEQSFLVEAEFISRPDRVLAGTQLQANIITGQKAQALVIPTEFLINGNQVMLANQEIRPIQIGISNNSWTEVLGGLEVDEELILQPVN